MKATEARQLKIDDRVTIRTSASTTHVGVVARIDWPNFLVAVVDGKGRRYYRERKYKSLYHVTKADRVPTEFLRPAELPSWLQFAPNEDCEIAADYCTDLGLEQAAIVLRDPRCGPNQLRRMDAIVIYRDTPHIDQLNRAIVAVKEFPDAHAKLVDYTKRLEELRDIADKLSTKEVSREKYAKMHGISVSTVDRMIKNDELKTKKRGRRVLIKVD